MEFTKQNLSEIRKDIDSALKTIGEKYKIDIKLGNTSYNSNEFNTKLTGSILDKSYKDIYIENDSLTIGKEFVAKNVTYIISDFKLTNRKYPFIIKNKATGTTYKVTESYFKNVEFIN